jgi:hypothetical protein
MTPPDKAKGKRMNNVFKFSRLVRFEYSFPNVDKEKRRQIYDILYSKDLHPQSCYGDGSNNSGYFFIPEEQVEVLKQRLQDAGEEIIDIN